MQLDDEQQKAIAKCCDTSNRIVSVTGQAGTGKTTILRLVHDHLTKHGYNVVLCAPTGKAAKRIFEATSIPAMTLHRLLEYPYPGERDPDTGKAYAPGYPKRDKFLPVDYDVVLADEYAMVNDELHRNLIDALPRAGCLRAFGDVNQLRPIEKDKRLKDKPTPFENLLSKFESITLEKIHRQGEGSGIVHNANLVLKGRIPKRLDEFHIMVTDSPIEVLQEVCIGALDNGTDFSKINHQVITATKRRWTGTVSLNTLLQNFYRPESDGWVELPRHDWDKNNPVRVRVGDKVIWTENNYDLDIMNGETGVVIEASDEFGELVLDLGDRTVVVPPIVVSQYVPRGSSETRTREYDPRKLIDLAYAVTTHKAQGSEYDRIIYVLNRSSFFMQERGNTYTALTRAREHVTLIADQASLSNMIRLKRM